MAVAKTYEGMEIVKEPFEENGKMYVIVRSKCPRCGGSGHYSYNQMDGTKCYGCMGSGIKRQQVRWYTDAQRATMDRAAEKRAVAAKIKQEERRIKFAPRNAYGFGNAGYITIYKGDSKVISEFFKNSDIDGLGHHAAWYNMPFGWFTPSTITVPENLPEGVEPIQITWDMVRDPEDAENLQMRENEFVSALVNFLAAEPNKSEYQGEIGDWLERDVTIKKNILFKGLYGDSHMHVMEDADENVYVWSTSSKSVDEGSTIHLKMKVKEHKEYKGIKQTIVYYCKIK